MPNTPEIRLFGLTFDRHQFIILLSSPLLLCLYYYHGLSFLQSIGIPSSVQYGDLHQRYGQFGLFFGLMGFLPFAYLLLFDRHKLKDYGMGAGDWRLGLKFLLLIPFVIVPLMWFAATMPDVRSEYPLAKVLFEKPELFWQYELMYFLFYYVAWEFYFRGFMLFGLAKSLGPGVAILIQTLASCLIHLGKPEGEAIGAILAGVVLGFIAWRTQSFWYGFMMHIAIGFFTDFFILIQSGVHIGFN